MSKKFFESLKRLKRAWRDLRRCLDDTRVWKRIANVDLRGDEWCFVCPYGIGDTYFVCALAESFGRLRQTGPVTMIVKPAHRPIAEMFPSVVGRVVVNDAVGIPAEHHFRFNPLVDYSLLGPGRPVVAHPYAASRRFMESVGYRGLTLLDMYRMFFRLPSEAQLSKPTIRDTIVQRAEEKCRSLGIPKGGAVLLVPAAVSTDTLPDQFWVLLVEKLGSRGFRVLLNSALPVEESRAQVLSLRLDEIYAASEYMGSVVSVRCGVCDLLSTARCSLTVIYPQRDWYLGTVFSISSLQGMGLSQTAREYVLDGAGNIEQMAEEVAAGIGAI